MAGLRDLDHDASDEILRATAEHSPYLSVRIDTVNALSRRWLRLFPWVEARPVRKGSQKLTLSYMCGTCVSDGTFVHLNKIQTAGTWAIAEPIGAIAEPIGAIAEPIRAIAGSIGVIAAAISVLLMRAARASDRWDDVPPSRQRSSGVQPAEDGGASRHAANRRRE